MTAFIPVGFNPGMSLDTLPDHTQLPDRNDEIVFAQRAGGNYNFQEMPQARLLTESIVETLNRLHPDEHFAIGQDCGIYWRLTEPPERGAECPDWFYVANVPPMLDGKIRRSYVLWKELIPPVIALEFVSGNGSEERDTTPYDGKFWVYERIIRPAYYGIYEVAKANLDMYHLQGTQYVQMTPNPHGRYTIPEMQVELGLWQGHYQNMTLPWMRWWDLENNLLLTGAEGMAIEKAEKLVAQAEKLTAQLKTQEAQEAQAQAEAQADRLAAKLRELGIDPTAL